MSGLPQGARETTPESAPVESVRQLIDHFRASCKPRERWRLGTEHELIGVSTAPVDLGDAIPYDGLRGIRALFGLLEKRGWAPVMEGDHPIALSRGDAQITLEPGGQFELAGRPVAHTDDYRADLDEFMREVMEASEPLELAWLCLGFRPFQTLEQVPWMPKGRYDIMRDYLPTRGSLAHEMMKRTATVQVNIDYGDEDDARAKLRASLAVTSLLTAIYANSAIVDERVSGFQSYRSHIWHDTDPDRCGILPFVFEDVDLFTAYTEWALDVPMFFVHRGGYLAAEGTTFRQFMNHGFRGHRPNMDDWALHLSTLFPESRMKGYIEIRACDAGTGPMILALGPLCRGLLYDDIAVEAATALTAGLDLGQRNELARNVARAGLRATTPDGRQVGELARELVAIAVDGLGRQAPDELHYLDPVRAIVESGRTQADQMIELWQRTGGDRAKVIREVTHRQLP
jgi:glutamate--cysteine ligase